MNARLVLSIVFLSVLVAKPLFVSSFLIKPIAAQEQQQANSAATVEKSENVLSELESLVEVFDPALTEPLEQLADSLMANGQFAEAHSILDRAMQITRVDQGLYTATQLPLLQKKIENYANWGRWDHTRTQISHMTWLLSSGKLAFTQNREQSLIEGLLHLSKIHLRGVAEDDPIWQDYHFRQAERVNRGALSVAEIFWGQYDPRLSQILYRQVRQYYLRSVAIEIGGTTGYKLRKLTPGESLIRDRDVVHRDYYARGLILLGRIQNIYANSTPPNVEAIALSDLYLADWQVLFTRGEEAVQSYRRSYERLLSSDIEQDQLTSFFDSPVLLPQPEFYATIDEAITARIEGETSILKSSADNRLPSLTFTEWSATFPNVQTPIELDPSGIPPDGYASFSIGLAGIDRKSVKIGGRSRQSVSTVDDVELIFSDIASDIAHEELNQKLYWLRFRPVLVGGVPQPASAILNYYFASAN